MVESVTSAHLIHCTICIVLLAYQNRMIFTFFTEDLLTLVDNIAFFVSLRHILDLCGLSMAI